MAHGRESSSSVPMSSHGFRLSYRLLQPGPLGSTPHGRLLFLHGFFGSGRNWSAVARGVMRSRPDWQSVLVDLRLHGESRGAPPPHTLAACALDVGRLVASLPESGGPTALLGHSFGGKVAMLASSEPDVACEQVWVVDSTPAAGETGAGAQRMIALLSRLPATFGTRKSGADAVEKAGFPRFVAEWMATNLVREDEVFRWRFDVGEMRQLLVDFFRADLWPLVEQPPGDTEFQFIRATRNSILAEADTERIVRLESEGSPVHLHILEGGHWLNVDNPGGIIALLGTLLPPA
jgi:pimeloyl-ACP methyl ester carboxylesterase